MITNERQYRITKGQFRRLREAVDHLEAEAAARREQSDVLANAELEALKSECEILATQIEEYESLVAGNIATLRAPSLEELPLILIRARIARGITQRQLAQSVGVKEQQIQRYEAERYSSANLSRLAAVARALHLDVSEVAELREDEKPSKTEDALRAQCAKFPIGEMYRRGWLEGFAGSLSAALANGEELAMMYVRQALPRRQPALLRQRASVGSTIDQPALLAWQCRILLLASGEKANVQFSRHLLTREWFEMLRKQSQYDDGPLRAREFLRRAGIPLVLEPHLPQTFLDGGAFLLPSGRPVIGMTLRYDRIDNFWFVLMHELVHVRDHLRKGHLEDVFDDLDSERDEVEEETDRVAGNLLLPEEVWETALARYVRNEGSVVKLAEELAISPAIIAGRIRHESDNYLILQDIVGHGKVRRLFPEVNFGR
jgi:HTH-type transcriptional regulator / antitoxin HigA